MPAMETEPGTASPSGIAISWLAASAAFPLTLIGAAFGQGLGALAGGCGWIGVALPLDRQVWALVNQPVLNFASLPSAGGYWLGSTLLPLAVAVTIIGFLPRARSFVIELTVVQIAWAMSVVAVAWVPLLDHEDGHLIRFLALHERLTTLVWLAPAIAACAALLPTLRLLELTRRRRTDSPRSYRLLVVAVHFGVPTVAWVALVSLVRGSLPLTATIAMAVPIAAALVFTWLRFPRPYAHRLELPRPSEIGGLAIAAALLGIIVWFAGRPLPDGRSAGVLWGQAQSFNNIRSWIDSQPVTGSEPDRPSN
jgi:hypothetical protein